MGAGIKNALHLESAFFFDMTCNEIFKYLENWAPKEIAWKNDNVGLQVGSASREVENIILCLEVNMQVIEQAIKKKCNLIISHHPLIFHPLKKIDVGRNKDSVIIEKLIKNDITLYSAHTNLDFTKDGVSFELAKKLKLQNIKFLANLPSNQFKLTVFVPEKSLEKVSEAMFNAGGGNIGKYSQCSFRLKGEGTFLGSEKSKPVVGEKNKAEKVEEVRLEIVVNSYDLKNVISAMLKAHPYEEPAYDVYPLSNSGTNTGAGAIGELKEAMDQRTFLKYVSDSINARNLRFTEGKKTKIKKVAVCGGSGSDMISTSISEGADAFITADIKYHTFHDAKDEILLIDAGHYETEIHALDEVERRLKKYTGDKSSIKIFKFSGSTNPVLFYNNNKEK
ncbi:MAG: Nif3-like dinuclear metal center hexameric protein [Ignavibacteriaceae bacterium]